MGQRIKLPVAPILRPKVVYAGGIYILTVRSVDLLVVPWILDGRSLYVYLLARLISLFVPLSLAALGTVVATPLFSLAQTAERRLFQAAAARVNLGYLMVCGSIGLLVLLMAPRLEGMLGAQYQEFSGVLIWLLVGNSAPVLFGATRLLMTALGRGAFLDLLSGVTSILILVSLVALPNLDGVLIAQIVAAAQLSHAGICALLLTQSGVWPGLTALFHREMRLF